MKGTEHDLLLDILHGVHALFFPRFFCKVSLVHAGYSNACQGDCQFLINSLHPMQKKLSIWMKKAAWEQKFLLSIAFSIELLQTDSNCHGHILHLEDLIQQTDAVLMEPYDTCSSSENKEKNPLQNVSLMFSFFFYQVMINRHRREKRSFYYFHLNVKRCCVNSHNFRDCFVR